MVEYIDEQLNAVFHALADPTRRALLKQVGRKPCTVTELAEPFDMSLAAVSKHLKVLESARLIIKKKDGRTYWCHLNYQPMEAIANLIREYEQFWESQLDSLKHYLDNTNTQEKPS